MACRIARIKLECRIPQRALPERIADHWIIADPDSTILYPMWCPNMEIRVWIHVLLLPPQSQYSGLTYLL